jgi:hypothetical protein
MLVRGCLARWQPGPSVVNSGSPVSSPSLSIDQDQQQYAARNEEPPVEVSVNQSGLKGMHATAGQNTVSLGFQLPQDLQTSWLTTCLLEWKERKTRE